MEVSSLNLKNFRNYDNYRIDFNNGVNVICGKNGLGKTNLLEAMFLCAVGKSFRTSKDIEMIKNDKDKYEVGITIDKDINESVYITYDRKRERSIKINGLYIRKMRHLMGTLMAVVFAPEDLLLISSGPSARRRFMDISLSQLSQSYYYDLVTYNKLVNQKNIYLKHKKIDSIEIDVFNEQLAETGSRIIFERIKFIEKINEFSQDIHSYITDSKEKINLKYIGSFKTDAIENDCEKIKDDYYKILCLNLEREKEREFCLFGPHKDDLDIFLNNENLKMFGSQGQKRTAVISMKIAELKLMEKYTGRKPVLFLDDVLSELDKKRQQKLLYFIDGIQTFITCTDFDIDIDSQNVNLINLEQK
ncbi:MAG: DNA replication/repair protein RecF [Clostridia bacterium]|nr:DNA replication/repair protein RecF [Clostridia bacterium]